MRILKFLVLLCFVGIGITFLLIAFVKFLSVDFFNQNNEEEKQESDVEGVTINSLYQPKLNDELILYLNGTDEPVILNYKLATGRQNIISKLTGADNSEFFPGKVTMQDSAIYWIKQNGTTFKLLKIDTQGLKREEKTIYTKEGVDQVLGLKIVDNGDIYFTVYIRKDEETTAYSIVRIREGKDQKIYDTSEKFPKVVVGTDDKSKPIVREYNDTLSEITGSCYLLDKIEVIGCEKAKGTEYFLESATDMAGNQTEEGFSIGIKGYIQVTNKKGEKKIVLEGEEDEHFESLYYSNGFVYFISGKVGPTSSGSSYGTFKPIALERISIDGTSRSKIKVLPSTLTTQIAYVGDEYIVLTMSELSSNKYDIKPANTWILNLDSEDLEQLTDIECSVDEFCESVLLATE